MASLSKRAEDLMNLAKELTESAKVGRDAAENALKDLTVQLSEATNEFAAYEKEAGKIREQLAKIATPADGEGQISNLERTLSLMATVQSRLLETQGKLAEAKSNAEAGQKKVNDARRIVAEAEATTTQASKFGKELETLSKGLMLAPLKTLVEDASAARSGELFMKAKARIEKDIPDTLYNRALDRRKAEAEWNNKAAALARRVSNKLTELLDKEQSPAEKVKRKQTKFFEVQDALRNLVRRGSEPIEQALAILKRVGDPEVAPLTVDQVSRINGVKADGDPDTALTTKRKMALDEEQKLLSKRIDRDAKTEAYEIARVEAIGKKQDPDKNSDVKAAKEAWETAETQYQLTLKGWQEKYRDLKAAVEAVREKETALRDARQKALGQKNDPVTDTTVKEAKDALEEAAGKQKDAERAYSESLHGVLHAWQAAVPDATWQLLEDFKRIEDVLRNLEELKTVESLIEELKKALKVDKLTPEEALKQDMLDLTKLTPNALVKVWGIAEEAYADALVEADDSIIAVDRLIPEQARQTARVKAIEQSAVRRRFSAMRGD